MNVVEELDVGWMTWRGLCRDRKISSEKENSRKVATRIESEERVVMNEIPFCLRDCCGTVTAIKDSLVCHMPKEQILEQYEQERRREYKSSIPSSTV